MRLPFPYFSVGGCCRHYLELIDKSQAACPLRINPIGNQPTAHPVAELALIIHAFPKSKSRRLRGGSFSASGNFYGPTADPLRWASDTASSVFSRTRQSARHRIWRGEGARTPHARPEVIPALVVVPCRMGPALNVTGHFSAFPKTGRARACGV